MARPRVGDGGDGIQIWRVAANILNKQSRTAEGGGPPAGGWGGGLTTHYRKTPNLLRNIHYSLGPGRILWQNDPCAEKWI
jgi:hypothetical protein